MDNGDKPGCGFRLEVIGDHVVSGRFWLLDPNRPHDFAAGQSVAITNIRNEGRTVLFSVNVGRELPQRDKLTFQNSFTGREVIAVWSEQNGEGQPLELVFKPVR
ncbi:MAG: hypothetical protein HY301_04610 [Verrucomicrobia bacterium]|nr:hypothetical protein [Verrucomicrobiota bacterium]